MNCHNDIARHTLTNTHTLIYPPDCLDQQAYDQLIQLFMLFGFE